MLQIEKARDLNIDEEIYFEVIRKKTASLISTCCEAGAISVHANEHKEKMRKFGELIGMSICNDMTSRNIEGENPLYLSQAKIYHGSNALGPMIRPIWEIVDHDKLDIYAKIERSGSIVWQAETSLKSLNRSFDDLIDYLFKCQHFPVGVILSTGTGIVPPLEISLQPGDEVTITVDQIGTLVNKVVLTPEDINERIK